MAKLYFKYGAMGSSKTAQALITKFNYEERGMSVWLIKPSTDTRDGAATVRSRIGLSAEGDVITPADDLFARFCDGHDRDDVVIADEAQFFTPEQVDELGQIVIDFNVPVLCFGLRTDFLTHLFPGSRRLFEIAESITEIKSVCKCGAKATVNARLDDDGNVVYSGEQVCLGGNDRYVAFVKLAEGVDPASLKDAIHEMQKAHQPLEEMEKSGLTLWYFLSPLATEHSSKPEVRNLVFILAIIAALLLLVSIMNYVLVAISDVIRRAREVGVRKCYGAQPWDINKILLKETAWNLGVSLAVAALLIFAFRGAVESLLGVPVKDLVTPLSVWIIVGIVILVFLVSAVIPARMFTKIPISSAFRGYKESKRRWKISLLAFQFAINAVLVSLVLIVSFQYRKVLNADPGYNYSNLVYETFPSYDQTKMTAIAGALRQLPEVEAAELTYVTPLASASGNNITLPGDDRELFNVADEYGATEGFFNMMGFRLVEGSAPKGPNDVAVSKSFVTKMAAFANWSDGAVGKIVGITEHGQVTICGVYEDYVIGSVSDPDNRPSVRFCWNKDFLTDEEKADFDWSRLMQTLVVKLTDVTPETMRKVEKTIREVAPDSDAEVKSYAETFRSLYDPTRQMKRTYTLGALFALLIAVIGLISYVRDENYRRSAEIAVRKVNGAQSSEIVSMLVTDILKVAVFAVIVGDTAAWLVAHYWLQQFAVKIALNPLFFIAADIIVLAIIVSVIVIGSLRIAHTNPVESLKNE